MGGKKTTPPAVNMNTNNKVENDRLHAVLREWKVNGVMPPRFEEQVWRRIVRAETPVAMSLWQALKQWVESTFSRPALALAYVAILLMVGLAAGHVRAQDTAARAEAQWRAQYVQSIDPYLRN